MYRKDKRFRNVIRIKSTKKVFFIVIEAVSSKIKKYKIRPVLIIIYCREHKKHIFVFIGVLQYCGFNHVKVLSEYS